MSARKSIAILVGLVLVSVVGIARFAQGTGEKKTFRVVYNVILKTSDGEFHFKGQKVRYVNVDGRMKEVAITPEGKEAWFSLNSYEGSFLGIPEKQIISPKGPFERPLATSDEILSKVAVGTDVILGYKVYVRKTKDGLNEVWSTPEVPYTPLKTIIRSKDVPSYTMQEAVAIYWEPVPEEVFTKPNWPINTFYLEDQIKIYEYNKVDPSAAKKELDKWKGRQ